MSKNISQFQIGKYLSFPPCTALVDGVSFNLNLSGVALLLIGYCCVVAPINTATGCCVVALNIISLLVRVSLFYKVKIVVMDNIVDTLNNAYQDFLAAAAGVCEANEASGSQKTAATDASLENFKQRWELFKVACDQAEEFVESVKQRIGSECLVDEATGSVTGKPGQPVAGLPPISAVRLEQMSKAVRWLVIELQQGSGNSSGSSHPNTSAPFDARLAEDTTQ